jgi:transcriptional regulator of nitric oxide reductase/ferredoxin
MRFVCLLIALVALLLAAPETARAEPWPVADDALARFAAQSLAVEPASVNIAPPEGIARPVRVNGTVAGYIGSSWEIARSAGYSGQPIVILVLVDTGAVIRGALLAAQQEPVLTLGIRPEDIAAFVGSFAGYDLKEPVRSVDATAAPRIAGATISSGVMRNAILRTGREIAIAYGLFGGEAKPQTGAQSGMGGPLSWPSLVAAGEIATLKVTVADADAALGVSGNAAPSGLFAELALAVLDRSRVGSSLLGETAYSELVAGLGPGDHALLVAGNGLYSFKGTGWRQSGVFERIQIEQGERTISLTAAMHRPLDTIAAEGAPEFRERAVFVVPASAGLDPAAPFRLSLLASRERDGAAPAAARFTLPVSPAAATIETPAAGAAEPLWEANWRSRLPAIAIVATMLAVLYVALIFQNQIARRPWFYRRFRLAYLTATVVLLGVVLGAQLSVVHVLTFLNALRTTFTWDVFLLEPAIFILWGWVAVAMLFWGRVYCGWLCPFGALQELIARAAQALGVRQIQVPFAVHERLWPTKYIIFLGLFAVSLSSMTLAFQAAEVEPFKTVWTLRFLREWPFVVYAVGLLAASAVIERFFCRYLCPLGAALAIPARLRMFEWLKRRPQCGRECRICATKCPVQAIHPEGNINPNECIYCLNCQTLYFDEHICPPLKARAARRTAYDATAREGAQP